MIFSIKNNKMFLVILFVNQLGCATSIYKVSAPNVDGTDIQVTPDRVITECEFISDYDGDRKDPYGFMIHILDLQKTVLTVSNGVVLEKEYCLKRQLETNKIIQQGSLVTVRGRGDANGPTVLNDQKYTFKRHGTFPDNGRSLNFLAIWNDLGRCYSAFNGEDDPCLKIKR